MMEISANEELKVLIGADVSAIQFAYPIILKFSGGQNRQKKYAELSIEAPFNLHSDTQTVKIEPGEIETLAPMLALINTKITDITYVEAEVISLAFSNGASISVKPIPKHEAWTLSGDDIGYYIGMGI